jgi:hypothetical protein
MAPRVLVPEVVAPPKAGDTLRRFREARDRAYHRATDPLWPLRDPHGAVPMPGAYEMPASELERASSHPEAGCRTQPGHVQPRWTLGPEAPAWLRRIWKENSREAPKPSREETVR